MGESNRWNNYAISTSDLAESLTKSSGSLVAANGTLEEAVALTATANTIIQDSDVVGTALKTVAMRLRGTSTKEMEEEGLDTDGAITSKSKLQSKVKGLSGVDILTDTGAYKSTYQILSEIANVWEDISDIDQAALLEILAGKRGGSVMAAILQNPETLKDAFESASEASGSALVENEKYMKSIQGRIDQFNNALQTMWANELNGDVIKWFVGLGKVLVQTIDYLGLLPSAFIVISLAIMKMNKMNLVEYFASIGTTMASWNTKLESLGMSLGLIKTTSQAAQAATQGLTVGMLQEKLAAAGVSEANQKLILSKVGLDAANKSQVISSELTTIATLKEAMANESLTTAQAFSMAQKLGLITVTKSLNGATTLRIAKLAGLTNAETINLGKTLGVIGATKTLTKEEIKNAIAKAGIIDAAKAETLQNLLLLASQGKLSASLKLLGMQINDFLAKNTLLLSLAMAVLAIWGVTKAVDGLIQTSEELQEKLTESNNKLESTTSELKDLENQLKETSDAIKELQSQGTLSFTDQEELRRLKAQKKEIEDTMALKSELETSQQKTVNKDAAKAYEAYKNKNFKNGKGIGEYAETYGKAGSWIGGLAGGALLGGKLGAIAGSFIPIPVVSTILGYAAGAFVGAAVGAAIGAAGGAIVSTAGQDVEEQLNDITSERAELKKKRDEAYKAYVADDQNKKLLKDYEKAEEKLAEYDTKMAEHVTEIQAMRSQMDWDTATPSQRETIEEMDDFIDRYKIIMGSQGATGSALERIFGYDKYKGISEQIDKLVEKYKKTEDETILSQIREEAQKAQADLADVGLSVQDVVDYYTLEKGLYDSNTIEGITRQYMNGIAIMRKFADASELSDYQQGGKVDLFKRPRVATSELTRAGWGEFEDDSPATVYTSTYTNEDETAAINFTPILTDGKGKYISSLTSNQLLTYKNNVLKGLHDDYLNLNKGGKIGFVSVLKDGNGKPVGVLSPDQLQQYAENVIAGVHNDFLNLQIGAKFDGENAKEQAEEVASRIHEIHEQYEDLPNMGAIEIEIDGKVEKIKFDDLFEIGEDGKFKAKEKEFEAMLEGMDEKSQNTFKKLAEHVKNNELTWDQAMESMKHSANLAGFEFIGQQIAQTNQEIFKSIKDDISGTIDTLEELSTALEDVASSMDLLNKAQVQMNNSGRISVKTALEIMQNTDRWNEILEIENGNIRLVGNATEILVEDKIALIKANLQNALATVQEQLATIDATNSSSEMAYTIEESTNLAVRELAGNVAYLTKMMEAYARIANGEIVDVGAFQEAAENAKSAALEATNYKKNSAKKVGKSELEKRKAEIEAQLGMLEGIDTASEFKDNYDYDKTPGDKYKDSKSGDDDRLANLQKKYEGKIQNLENQKTWLENEISREEEIGLGVSKSYYEEQIKLNDRLSEQYEKQRQDLIDLRKVYPEGSEKWYEVSEAIWEMDHALQELTTDSMKASKSIIELYNDAFSKIGEAYDDKISISDDRIASMQNYAELLDLQGGTATKGLYDKMIAENQGKLDTQWEKFNEQEKIIQAWKTEINPHAEGTDEWESFELAREKAIIAASAEQRRLKLDMQDTEKQVLQLKEEFKELATQAWDNVRAAYDNRDTYYQNQIALNDRYISKLETLGINVPDEAYEAQIDSLEAASASKLEDYLQARQEMIDYEGIYGADSQEYIDKYNETIELHHEYLDYENQILEKQQQVFDNQIGRFNQVIERITNATQRMQNISSLLEREDVATEDGEWTDEGLTRLGMAYQQMEYYKQSSEEITKQMDDVTKAYKRGEISEKKYYETMQELENQQWDAINSYEDMKDAIVDMEEARIDMIEEGLDKEAEAYQELIDLKKEELDAERDLYDFKKNVEKQTKDIAALERRIASMSGSTDAATIAERTKLEQQLREAQEGLNDTFYGHAMNSQSKALDDELDAYTKSSEDYIESLREAIKDTDLLIEQTYQKVIQGSNTVLETIYSLSETYKFPIDENLTNPWENATQKSLDFETYAKGHIKNIYDYVEEMKGSLAKSLGDPYDSRTTDDMGNPLYEFSWYAAQQIDKIIRDNTDKQDAMKTSLDGGFEQAKTSIQGWETVASTAIDNVIEKFVGTEDKPGGLLKAIQDTSDAIANMPNYDGGYTNPADTGSSSDNGGNGGYVPKPATTYKTGTNVKNLQKVLNAWLGTNLTVDGSYGPATEEAVKRAQKTINNSKLQNLLQSPTNGKYDEATMRAMHRYFQESIKKLKASGGSSSAIGQGVQKYTEWKSLLPAAMYAKGTLGTTSSGLAITDESWIGEEITLAAGKNGQLQYLKKGSAVMPADISANLVEWGKLNPDMMNIGGAANLNMISNAVNKPELNFSFDSLVHVDNCSQDTLKDLEKMVDTKINQFNKQLNQSLRKFK